MAQPGPHPLPAGRQPEPRGKPGRAGAAVSAAGRCSHGAPAGVRHVGSRPWTGADWRTISSASGSRRRRPRTHPTIGAGRSRNGQGPRRTTMARSLRGPGTGMACGPGDRVGEASRQYGVPARGGPASGHRRRTAVVRRESQPVSGTGEDRCGGLLRTGKGLRHQGTEHVARADRPPHRRRRRPAGSPASWIRPWSSSGGTSRR